MTGCEASRTQPRSFSFQLSSIGAYFKVDRTSFWLDKTMWSAFARTRRARRRSAQRQARLGRATACPVECAPSQVSDHCYFGALIITNTILGGSLEKQPKLRASSQGFRPEDLAFLCLEPVLKRRLLGPMILYYITRNPPKIEWVVILFSP